MKTKYLLIPIALLLAVSVSCKKGGLLDETEEVTLNEETTFADSSNTIAFLSGIYSNISIFYDVRNFTGGGFVGGSDEGIPFRYNGNTLTGQTMRRGLITKSTQDAKLLQLWSTPYSNIRAVNVFLKNLPKAPLSDAKKQTLRAEARFLRAWYYSLLVKAFGGVPILEDRIYEADDDFRLARSTYEGSVNYIISELDQVKNDLSSDKDMSAQDYGRITSGACLALKSKVLLYAASPLFNGGQFSASGEARELAGYSSYSKERWKLAKDAALAVINTGQYALLDTIKGVTNRPGEGFYYNFILRDLRRYSSRDVTQNEMIFGHILPNNRYLEQNVYLPASRGGNWLLSVNQRIVDRFGMKNGKAITDPTSGYNPQDPYTNREPRFYYSIIYDGALWRGRTTTAKSPVNTRITTSNDQDAVNNQGPRTHTGYYFRKMLSENVSGNQGSVQRSYQLIRYAEILLNYAEATNEFDGPTEEVYQTLRQIRSRAGIDKGDGNYGMKAGMSQEEMRKFIQNERAVELFAEEHRFWDARRWKTAEVDFNLYPRGVKITEVANGLNYEYLDVETGVNFYPNYGLFPIWDSEISKNTLLIQNPGW